VKPASGRNIEYRLRPAAARDLEWLVDLRLETMSGHLDAAGKSLSLQDQKDRVLRDFDSIRIVAMNDEDIGMLKLLRNPEQWKLVQIQLRLQFQGLGLGTRILTDLLVEAQTNTVPVTLSVLKVNPAKRLYERLGFCVVSEKEAAFEMRFDTT
jgi:ribosomal protein S18 acetylase RimI-like enzyme